MSDIRWEISDLPHWTDHTKAVLVVGTHQITKKSAAEIRKHQRTNKKAIIQQAKDSISKSISK